MSASIGEIKKMKISLLIFMNFTGEIIKSDDRLCHYLCYKSHFLANDRKARHTIDRKRFRQLITKPRKLNHKPF